MVGLGLPISASLRHFATEVRSSENVEVQTLDESEPMCIFQRYMESVDTQEPWSVEMLACVARGDRPENQVTDRG